MLATNPFFYAKIGFSRYCNQTSSAILAVRDGISHGSERKCCTVPVTLQVSNFVVMCFVLNGAEQWESEDKEERSPTELDRGGSIESQTSCRLRQTFAAWWC